MRRSRRRCSVSVWAVLVAADPERIVYVRGDRSIPYGDVMHVMGTISSAGFAKVLLIAEAASTTSVRAR